MTTIIKIDPEHPESDRIDQAVAILESGGVIAASLYTRHTWENLETFSSSPRAISLSPLWMT
jgi:hypothetical protein